MIASSPWSCDLGVCVCVCVCARACVCACVCARAGVWLLSVLHLQDKLPHAAREARRRATYHQIT